MTARPRQRAKPGERRPAVPGTVQFSVHILKSGGHGVPGAVTPGAVYNVHILTVRYGGVVVKFKSLLDRWKKEAAPALTAAEYSIRLSLDDASRLHALAGLFPGRRIEEIISDLLHAGLDEIAAAMPYERGPKVISHDDQGDPVYEDVGLTPRFVELTRKFKKDLESQARK
jgi:hypothetical protein